MVDSRNGVLQAIYIILSEAHLDPGFITAGLFAGAARECSDDVGAPLGKDGLNGVAEAGAVGQQQHHRGNAPRHADHGDGSAAPVVDHRFPGLAPDISQHDRSLYFSVSSF